MSEIIIEKIVLNNISSDLESKFNKFLLECPYSTVFHTLDWLRVIAKTTNKFCRLLLAFNDYKIVGVFPYFTINKSFLRKICVSSLDETRYSGPIYLEDYKEVISLMIDKILSLSHNSYYFYSAPGIDTELFFNKDFVMEKCKTAVLDVSRPIEEIHKKMKSRTRRAIKRAQREGVTIVDGDIDDLDIYYKMVRETYVRSDGIAPIKNLIENSINMLSSNNILKFSIALHDNKPVGGLITLHFNGKIYFWSGAAFNKYRKLQPNSLLFWNLIQKVSQKDQSFDFLGIDDLRLSRFKMSWGCKESVHYYCSKKTGLLDYLSKLRHRNR